MRLFSLGCFVMFCYIGSQLMPLLLPFPAGKQPANFYGSPSNSTSSPDIAHLKQYAEGKRLFAENCARCHSSKMENDMIGPALLEVVQRAPSREWLISYIRDSGKMVEKKDPYAMQIHSKWKGKMDPMPLTDEEINLVIKFIEQASLPQ